MSMAILVFAAGAIFMGCCVAEFYFVRRIRADLAERHPHILLKMAKKALFIDSAVLSFALGRRGKGLDDPDLTRKTKELLYLTVVAIASWLTLVVLLLTGWGLPQS